MLNLKELEKILDEAISKETSESLIEWLLEQRGVYPAFENKKTPSNIGFSSNDIAYMKDASCIALAA